MEHLDLLGDAEQILHVMAHLMGNDIGLSEISWGAKALPDLLEEAHIQIDVSLETSVKWPDARLSDAAHGLDSPRKMKPIVYSLHSLCMLRSARVEVIVSWPHPLGRACDALDARWPQPMGSSGQRLARPSSRSNPGRMARTKAF